VMIGQHTVLYAVLGRPIAHSLSPAAHNAAFSAARINAVYLAFETADAEGALRAMRCLNLRGASITIPLKSAVVPFLDEIDPVAQSIGAVNTIVNENGLLRGFNTDATAALGALQQRSPVAGKRCAIIGAGGAARAVGFALKQADADLTIVNRSPGRGRELARALESPFIPLDRLGGLKADILVQTTPVGMFPRVDRSPVPEHILHRGMVVMDIIYNPVQTRLLREAGKKGCITLSGMDMFILQAGEQFRLWTGVDPPLGVMDQAVKGALERQYEKD